MSLISKLRSKSVFVQSASLAVLALSVYVPGASAAVPSVVIDAQQTIATGYYNPQAIATQSGTNQNGIFVADTNNNRITVLVNGFTYVVNPTGFTLNTPQALAMDAQGDLFIGDTPTSNGTTVGRIIEMTASNFNLTGAAQLVYSGAPLSNPISLAVDSAGTLFIGDYPPSGDGAIYSLASGAAAPTRLTLTGVPKTLTPAALVRDASTNLYFTDNGSFDLTNRGGVYRVAATGGAAKKVATQSLTINQPSGLTLDPAGNLYIATLIGTGASGQQIVVVPAAAPTSAYILPSTGINSGSGLASDPNGSLDVLSSVDNSIFQISTTAPINLGSSSPSAPGYQFIFNFEFNKPVTLGGFRVVSAGDVSTEVTQLSGGSCTTGAHDTVGGATVATDNPYTCDETYEGTPTYPGLRNSAILVEGSGTTILASEAVYQIGFGGVQVTYPLAVSAGAGNFQEPQAIAISGLNNTVYVADTAAGFVYSTNGLAGSKPKKVSTGKIKLVAPSGLAVDGAGDLYIADFGGTNPGQVVKVPATGGAAAVVNTGGLLQHPIALAIDNTGALYIGDAGPGGQSASAGNPGYLIKIPAGGTAVKFTTPGVSIVFPQALGVYFYTNTLVVGDGGDLSGSGQVDYVSADGTQAGQLPLAGVTDPTGIAFDPAGDMYVLDGTANTITVDPVYPNGPPAYNLQFDNSTFGSASAMAISAGGQSLIVADLGGGTANTLHFLNGNTSTLAFGTVQENTQSQPLTATVENIGNATMVLNTPFFSSPQSNAAFSMLNSTTCAPNISLQSTGTCAVNFEFTPTSTGPTSQTFTFNSNAYNTGIPVLTLQGTGSATGNVSNTKKPQK